MKRALPPPCAVLLAPSAMGSLEVCLSWRTNPAKSLS